MVYEKETDVIFHLQTTDGDIDITTNHPFYVEGEGWRAEGDLKVGDKIYALHGSTVTILVLNLKSSISLLKFTTLKSQASILILLVILVCFRPIKYAG